MKTITTDIRSAAIISFILMLPGLLLLFGVLWLLPTAFIIILTPIVRTVRAGNSVFANPVKLVFSVAFLTIIGTMWVWGFTDHLPCFLGVPDCD